MCHWCKALRIEIFIAQYFIQRSVSLSVFSPNIEPHLRSDRDGETTIIYRNNCKLPIAVIVVRCLLAYYYG